MHVLRKIKKQKHIFNHRKLNKIKMKTVKRTGIFESNSSSSHSISLGKGNKIQKLSPNIDYFEWKYLVDVVDITNKEVAIISVHLVLYTVVLHPLSEGTPWRTA